MQCPVCNDKMKQVEKCGIELDICPACKGVWLDRGELEKLMEYAANNGTAANAPEVAPPTGPEAGRDYRPNPPYGYSQPYRHHDDDDDHDHDDRHGDHHGRQGRYGEHGPGYGYGGQHGPYGKKKSWVSNLFEMFGD